MVNGTSSIPSKDIMYCGTMATCRVGCHPLGKYVGPGVCYEIVGTLAHGSETKQARTGSGRFCILHPASSDGFFDRFHIDRFFIKFFGFFNVRISEHKKLTKKKMPSRHRQSLTRTTSTVSTNIFRGKGEMECKREVHRMQATCPETACIRRHL